MSVRKGKKKEIENIYREQAVNPKHMGVGTSARPANTVIDI